MELKIVAAMCDGNRGVGKNGHLPWPYLKEDVDYYLNLVKKKRNPEKKNITIHGRRTWEGLKQEKKRDLHTIEIVISNTYDGSKDPFHPIVVPSLEEAVKVAMTPELQAKVENIWVLGGQRVWESYVGRSAKITLETGPLRDPFPIRSSFYDGCKQVLNDTIKHPLCKRIYLTRIYTDFASDVIFPAFEDKFFKSSDPEVDDKMREDKGIQYQFLVYDRK